MSQSQMPAWWFTSRELEQAEKLKEAEELLRASIPHQAFALEIAILYRDRMIRLRAAGDTIRADEAKSMASDWACFYACMATSGGEGAALSLERDEFLRTL